MTIPGEVFKSILTGKRYLVRMRKGLYVVLESEDKTSQILTEKGNLNLFYEKVENEARPQDFKMK